MGGKVGRSAADLAGLLPPPAEVPSWKLPFPGFCDRLADGRRQDLPRWAAPMCQPCRWSGWLPGFAARNGHHRQVAARGCSNLAALSGSRNPPTSTIAPPSPHPKPLSSHQVRLARGFRKEAPGFPLDQSCQEGERGTEGVRAPEPASVALFQVCIRGRMRL
jgi:hypothetical protein